MRSVHLPQLLHETRGVLHKAHAHLHVQRAQLAVEREGWEAAASSLLALAKIAAEQCVSTQAWRELMLQTLQIATLADAPALMAEAVEQHMGLAWSGAGEHSMPWEVSSILALAQRLGRHSAGAHLGDLLARRYPTFPYGPYAAAHFRELTMAQGTSLDVAQCRANALRFERARAQAEALWRTDLAARCALRQGVAMMWGGQREQGRALLRALPHQALTLAERQWLVGGLSRSERWLDRVRAADLLDDMAEALRQSRPEAEALTWAQLERLLDALLWREDLELSPTEDERLVELVRLIHDGEPRARHERTLQVRRRLALARQTPAHSPQAEAIAQDLRDQAPALGESWSRAASSLLFLRQLTQPGLSAQDAPAIPREAPEPWLRGAHLALELLHAHARREAGRLEHLLTLLRQALTHDPALTGHPERLGPLSAAWPTLLQPLELTPEQAQDPSELERREHIKEQLMHAIAAWAPRSPSPSYGWWALGAHLAKHQLWEALKAVARRAASSPSHEHERADRAFALGKLLAHVIAHEDRAAMLTWLELADSLDP